MAERRSPRQRFTSCSLGSRWPRWLWLPSGKKSWGMGQKSPGIILWSASRESFCPAERAWWLAGLQPPPNTSQSWGTHLLPCLSWPCTFVAWSLHRPWDIPMLTRQDTSLKPGIMAQTAQGLRLWLLCHALILNLHAAWQEVRGVCKLCQGHACPHKGRPFLCCPRAPPGGLAQGRALWLAGGQQNVPVGEEGSASLHWAILPGKSTMVRGQA